MADTTNPFGGAAGSSGGMFGGGMWGGGGGMSYGMPPQQGYGGYGGMQSPYGGGYGGIGGGMPYGGGYGMQSPYGAPGGYGGGYSPYGMPQGYGGGYGMQSPYGGGYAPQQGYSPYAQQSSYGYSAMPQQQTMMAQPQAALQTAEATATDSGGEEPTEEQPGQPGTGGSSGGNYAIKTSPWGPQATGLARMWEGSGSGLDVFKVVDPETGKVSYRNPNISGAYAELEKQQGLGPLGFDPNSEAALQRMQALAQGSNPMLAASIDATHGIASGQDNIGTGGMFQSLYGNPGIMTGGRLASLYDQPGIMTGGRLASLYDQPGIQNMGQYQSMYDTPGIGGIDQYGRMAGQNAIGNADQYQRMIDQGGGIEETPFNVLYQQPGVQPEEFRQLASNSGSIGTGQMEDIYGGARGPGSLTGGAFGQVARGDLMNANPYREQAIQQAMGDTADQVKATMSARGRFGSDAYGDAMGKALGQVATQARMAGYDTDTANMMAAAQARSGETLARQGVGLQAAQGIMSAGGQNFQNQLAAITGLTNASQNRAQNRLSAATGLASAQGTNAAQRLAQIQGLSGIQGQNYGAQLNALQNMNSAQQMANQQRMAAATGLTGAQGQNWQNQLGAANALTGVQGQNWQNQLGAATTLGNVQGQNWQNQLGAANALTGVNSQDIQNRLQAAGMAPAMQGLRYDDAGRLLQAGATREQMAQSQRNYGWNQLGQFSNLIGNVPGTAGTQQQPDKPWWETALGAASTVGGIWGGLGGGI